MKATAERSSTTASRSNDLQRSAFFPSLQTKLTVNKPGDKHEQEADKTADKVMRMASPEKDKVQKQSAPEKDKIQKKERGGASISDGVAGRIQNRKTGGQRMDAGTRSFMESRFNADFSNVRVHTDNESASLNGQLSARAFTTENHIFFGKDEYQPGSSDGKHLLAHELTHTIQQGAAQQHTPQVSSSATPPPVQRLGISDALDYFANKAYYLPGFRLLTILMGFNPINMANADRSTSNILRGTIELIPGATLITQALENHGVFQRAGSWVEQQLSAFSSIGTQIRQGVDRFLDGLGWRDIFDLGGVWERAKAIFTAPIGRIISFVGGLVTGLMDLVRHAILRPLAGLVKNTRGYDLLCAVLGRDPITGDAVPRTADTLIGGFMKLIGREDIWDNIKKGNAIGRAWAWFQGALGGLVSLVTSIPGQVIATLRSITWQDVVSITGVFSKVFGLFSSIAGNFFSWAFGTILELLEIIFSVVAPGVIPYVKKAAGAFRTILDNPIGFVGNLVRAGRLGFEMFGRNIVTHLKTALIKWITGPLGEAGVYIPKSFDLIEIIKLVLSVLGLTWTNIRGKLVKIIPEPVLVALEKTADILVTLVKDGPVAAWEQIKAELSELKSMMIAEVIKLVSTEIVKAAVTKVVSMINPAGAVIQAITAIYNTVMFFVERISQIAATVASFVDSIAAIAAGNVAAAAARVEATMANTLTLIISFLARLVGLGGIPNKIVGIVRRIRAPIDRGLDKVVAWLGTLLKRIGGAIRGGIHGLLQWWKKRTPVSAPSVSHTLTFTGERESARLVVQSVPKTPDDFILDFQPTPTNKAKVKVHQDKINDLKTQVVKAQAKNPPDEASIKTLDQSLTIEFNALGALLSTMIGGSGDEGSAQKPVPIDYPKRRASAYPNIYVGPRTNHRVSQDVLKKAAGLSKSKAKAAVAGYDAAIQSEANFKAWNGTVSIYRASGTGQSIGEVSVGLDPAFASLVPGKVIVYHEKRGTGGGGKINDVFRPYGFRPSSEGLDGDHVLERQLGGPDAINNLWPLDASENRSSGSKVKSMPVQFRGTQVTVHEARNQLPKDNPLHLLVRSVR